MALKCLLRKPFLVAFGALAVVTTLVAACGAESTGAPTPFSLGGASQIIGFTPTPTAAPFKATPAPKTPRTAQEQAPPPATAPPGGGGPSGGLQIASVGNDLKFDKSQLSASPGAQVTVILKNNATSKALQHNWVLVKAGAEDAVATAGLSAGAGSDWVPKGNPNVIANTKLVDGGSSGQVTFVAPPAGAYGFICSFPGHAGTMRGTLEVKG